MADPRAWARCREALWATRARRLLGVYCEEVPSFLFCACAGKEPLRLW